MFRLRGLFVHPVIGLCELERVNQSTEQSGCCEKRGQGCSSVATRASDRSAWESLTRRFSMNASLQKIEASFLMSCWQLSFASHTPKKINNYDWISVATRLNQTIWQTKTRTHSQALRHTNEFSLAGNRAWCHLGTKAKKECKYYRKEDLFLIFALIYPFVLAGKNSGVLKQCQPTEYSS